MIYYIMSYVMLCYNILHYTILCYDILYNMIFMHINRNQHSNSYNFSDTQDAIWEDSC